MKFRTAKLNEATDAGSTRLTDLQQGIDAGEVAVTAANSALQSVRGEIKNLQKDFQVAFGPFGTVEHCELPNGAARAGLDTKLKDLKRRLTAATQDFTSALSERAGLIEALREEQCRK